MAQHSGFFNSNDSDPRKYQDIDFSRMFSMITGGHGYVDGYLDELKVVKDEDSGLKVLVSPGAAWLGEPSGWWFVNDEDFEQSIAPEVGGTNRIDRIVVRMDRTDAVRTISIELLKGDVAEAPEPKDITQNENIFELSLAQVFVTGGETKVTVLDERDGYFCGCVTTSSSSSLIHKNPTPIKPGDVLAGNLLSWIEKNGRWEAREFGQPFDGTDIIKDGGELKMPFFSDDNVTKEQCDVRAFANNQILNADFEDGSANWVPVGSTLSVTSNIMTITGGITNQVPLVYQNTDVPVVVGNKLYARCRVRVTTTDCAAIKLVILDLGGVGSYTLIKAQNLPTQNQWYDLSGVYEVPAGRSGTWRVAVYHQYESGTTADGKIMEIDGSYGQGVELIDLSTDFNISEIGKRLYRQPNGQISTDVRDADKYIGYVLDNETALIGVYGGVDKEYTDNMVEFNIIPGKSGQTQIKIKPATSAIGVMVRRSTTSYDETGIAWGDLVCDVTDWKDYDGDNEWFDDIGLINGTRYYYKAFPYAGNSYNSIGGENEKSCKAGGLHFQFTYDSSDISGALCLDSSGNGNNGTNSNVTIETGDIGERGVFNGASSYTSISGLISEAQFDSSFTVTLLYTHVAGVERTLFGGHQYRGVWVEIQSDGKIDGWLYDGSYRRAAGTTTLQAGETYRIAFRRSKFSGLTLKINNVTEGTNSFTGNANSYAYSSMIGVMKQHNYGGWTNGKISQFRFFTRDLADYELDNIDNGGAYC